LPLFYIATMTTHLSLETLKIKYFKHLTVLLSCVLLTACNEKPRNNIDYDQKLPVTSGGIMIDAMIGEPTGLIFMTSGESASSVITSKIFNSLLTYNGNLDLEGELAESWSISKDKKSITFKLKPNLRWADGKPLTSDDVLFTWQLITDENTRSPYASDYLLVKQAEALTPHTFRVSYEKPFVPALDSWAGLQILPKHLLQGKDVHQTAFSQQPVGSSYYQLKKWNHGESITLSRNKYAVLGPAHIEQLISRIIPDTATQFLELMADNIDQMNLDPITYARVVPSRPNLEKRLNLYKELGNGYTYLGFNLRREPFNDIRVRKAINYAIDKQEIIDGVYLGLGLNIASPYKPGTRWSNPNLAPYSYQPKKALALLAEAGYKKNADGLLERNGRVLSFEIITNNGNKQREKTAVIIQRRLKELGINVTIRTIEWASFIKNFINTGDFDVTILGWSLGVEPDQYNIWHSSQQAPGQFNFIGYNNPKVDKLLEQGRTEFDVHKRTKIYHAFAKELLEDSPIVYLTAGYGLTAIHKRVQGIADPIPAAGVAYDDHKWYIPNKFRRNHISAH